MNNKKIVAGLLALTFIFGGAALPNTVVNNSVVASASEEDAEVLRYGDYKYILREDGTAEIVEGHFSTDEIEIPGEINGAVVTSIGEDAFDYYNPYIKSIVIPDSVTVIKEGAFDCLFELESITLPKNLKYIDDRAFEQCRKIKNIVIPDGVKTIGYYAFSGCESIESLVIPDSVEFIDKGAFSYCMNLKSITLSDGLKEIITDTFLECRCLESIVIPDSVENIRGEAFYRCYALKSVTLPKGLKEIGHGVFSDCVSLEGITIPEGVEKIGGCAFLACHSLENVVIPDSVKTIGEYAFTNCHSLKSVTIPASVTEINEYVFSYYDSKEEKFKPLEDVTINCYANSAAEKYAIANGLNYKLIDEKLPACPPPKRMVIKAELSEEYHQIRLRWKPYENAEKYGIAVYLSGKWRVWTSSIPADVTVFTSPKNLTPGKTYKVAVAARVNGKWNVKDAVYDAVTVTVK
ncbi:leucine-rich repeat protein [Ruminococcus albus]|uniref:Leucine rich repeat-containing protein n=1 Tax=Ruminococcus albus TaxID=1264 RepID=A0A1I1ETB4_RUMAL|nr:leucine-rich repeat protein [Ruminococcus albus]SFB88140.1 Leucine rich repeat-containing protein [Ruminococcus albus]